MKNGISKKMIFSRPALFLLAAALVLLFFGRLAPAGAAPAGGAVDFSVEFNPEIPGPNTTVFARAQSYNFDINRSYISWFVDGKLESRGMGEKNFSFRVGDRGEKTTLYVSLSSGSGLNLSKRFDFNPADVDLLWKAETYTPFFYKGKAMPTPGARVRVAAIPHFGKYAAKKPSTLVYKWKLNNKNRPEQSGAGMDTFAFKTGGPMEESVVSVEVSDYRRSAVAKNSIRIVNRSPELFFYRDRPLEGLAYGSALKSEFDFRGEEASIKAEPYFFSDSALKTARYEWKMNGDKIRPEEKKNTLNFRVDSGVSGTALIMLKVSSPYKILQFAERAFRINF